MAKVASHALVGDRLFDIVIAGLLRRRSVASKAIFFRLTSGFCVRFSISGLEYRVAVGEGVKACAPIAVDILMTLCANQGTFVLRRHSDYRRENKRRKQKQ